MPEVKIGRYELLRRLGEGGMALVHLARQEDLQRFVALKELRGLHGDDPALARRFLREARLAGSLTDPHVVTVYEYFEHGGTPYLAMEYVERGSLRPYVGHLNLPQISGVLESVLAGLMAAERAGIVHRDLKPENVLVAADGRVKIADFGIAKATHDVGAGTLKTSTGMLIGTPAYMAPEQAMGEKVGPWTDLYAVGCLAFELFTGRRPFHDVDSAMVILMRHATEPIPPVASIVPDVDPRISSWIERLVLKDPNARTRSAAAAWDEYEEIALDLLGPRWRRDSKLLHQPGDAVVGDPALPATARPYTPPPPDLPAGPLGPRAEMPAPDPPAGRLGPEAERAEPPPPDPPAGPEAEPAEPPPPDLPTGPLAAQPEQVEMPPPRRARAPRLLPAAAALAVVIGLAAVLLLPRGGDEAPSGGGDQAPSLTANASFEDGTSGWEAFQGTITAQTADDAPDGSSVVRVESGVSGDQYAIDDEPDTVVSASVNGRHYTASAWVAATDTTDGKPVCIAIREWADGQDVGSAATVVGKVTATVGEYRRVSASYLATADGNTIAVHVFRWADDVVAGEAFLVDAITLTADDAGGPDGPRVPVARC